MYTYICTLYNKHFAIHRANKITLTSFLPNLYFTSIKRSISIKRTVFKGPTEYIFFYSFCSLVVHISLVISLCQYNSPLMWFSFFIDQVGAKQQALEQVANEFEVLEKDKEEIQQWISDVKKELSTTADQEDQNPEVVVRRRKLKVC